MNRRRIRPRARPWLHAGAMVGVALAIGCHQPDSHPPKKAATNQANGHASAEPMTRETEKPSHSTNGPPANVIQGVSNDGTFRVSYTTQPSPIPKNEPFALQVWVTDAKNPSATLKNASLAADAAMPAHQHGMNTVPIVKSLGDGRFQVEAMMFHMAGHWELYLDITRDGITERAQFDVELE